MGLSEKTQALGSAAGSRMSLGAMPRARPLSWMEPMSNEPCVKGFLDIIMEKNNMCIGICDLVQSKRFW